MPDAEPTKAEPKKDGESQKNGDSGGKASEPADELVTTQHSITVDGAELQYTATAGRMVLRIEGHTEDKFDGAPAKAEIFFTSYVLDTDAEQRQSDLGQPNPRPVTFA